MSIDERTRTAHQQVILDSITEGVFTVDMTRRITSFNRAAETITGIPRDRAVGSPCKDILRADVCERACVLQETMRTGRSIKNREISIIDATGSQKSISVTTALLKDSDGTVIGGVETFRDMSEIHELRREIRRRYEFHDIISKNDGMLDLIEILPDIAESPSTVLITGESGTGKELFARAIHELSERKDRPFVAVNCGALPDTLLESELFGYKAGAFTDAKRDKPGKFAAAEGGTLFLDEIGDVSKAMQVRLLRFLQERVFEPLGAVQPVTADVRVVAATNQDLDALVRSGEFRDDLYYRINIVKLEIPPLRERAEDIPLLVHHFIERFNAVQGKEIAGIDPDALACLMRYGYPGNVRELENIIEHSFVLCRGSRISERHLPASVRAGCREESRAASEGGSGAVAGAGAGVRTDRGIGTAEGLEAPAPLEALEAAYLKRVLEANGWNCSEAARELGVHRTTLYRKLKAYGLRRPGSEDDV